MYTQRFKFPDGEIYNPGICTFCKQLFDEESSGGYDFGHKECAEQFEAESNRKSFEKLKAMLPPGTRFDLAGGAACD